MIRDDRLKDVTPTRVTTPATTRRRAYYQPRIAIIGCSLTGPMTALLLLQRGFEHVTVYEAALRDVDRAGGVIGLEHSALDILEGVGIEQNEYVTHRSENVIHASVYHRVPSPAVRRVYPGRSTTWTQLHTVLLRHLPAGIVRYGARVKSLVVNAGQPALLFDDERIEYPDLVVFADGRHSIGREQLNPERPLRFAGYVAHRGQALRTSPSEDFLSFEAHPGAAQFNLAGLSGGCDWTFYLNADEALYTDLFGAEPLQRLYALSRHVGAAAREYVDANAIRYLPEEHACTVRATTDRAAVPIMDVDPPTRMVWPVGNGHAVLLGDALAPVRPHTARGANNGIEQAAGLAAALRQHLRHGADLSAALTGWQHRHLPSARTAVEAGPRLGTRLGLGWA